MPQAQATWNLDAPSFLIGVIAALVIVGLLVLFRQPLRDGLTTIRDRLRDLREQLTAGAERRYREALRDRLTDLHLSERSAPFEELYLPPNFDPPHPRPSLVADREREEPRPVAIPQALAAALRLAVLGAPGSGRTSLLGYLARIFAAQSAGDALHLNEQRLPVLIHLSEIDWDAERSAAPADPSVSLIGAAILHAPRLIAANLTALLKSRLNSKGLILLIDGWDEIDHEDRDTAYAWLSAILERYPDVRIVIGASHLTCAPLYELGFAGLSIGPLRAREVQTLAERWAAAAGGGSSDAAMLAESMRQPPGAALRPLDFTLAASVWHKQGSIPLNTLSAYDRWIDLALGDAGVIDTLIARSILARLAWTLFDESRSIATREEIAALAAVALPADVAGKPAKPGLDIGALADSALFIPLGQGLGFAHRRIAAYLAAAHARDSGQAMTLATRLDDPAWDDVTYFFAGLGDASPLVNAAWASPDDLFRSTLTRLGEWASIAPADAAWRGRVMSELVKLMLAPDTPNPLRERVMRAVVATRDKGLAYLFKQLTGRPEPHFRQLALRAFGLMRREADVPVVGALTSDVDVAVQSEALRALGEIDGQAAVDKLAEALLELDDEPRRVAAEALARCGKAGWDLLKEGATLADEQGADVVRVRRAAVFGLARIDQDWARELLTRVARDDKQWAVRSSATDALRLAGVDSSEAAPVDVSPLDMNNLGWLVDWSASKGQPLGIGKPAEQALQRALIDLDPNVRLAAIHSYAYLGDASIMPLLRTRLSDEVPHVREAAYYALEVIAWRKGEVVER
ncbi:MAG TPA: HEAT repeat domain-containing protein [Anaerolineae bacterium]|nr:HEAT repeat domain-containing protein [Anaerolineae bacterium]